MIKKLKNIKTYKTIKIFKKVLLIQNDFVTSNFELWRIWFKVNGME